MGCTWVLGIFYVNDRTTWVQYIFALCNSLQGFFIFLFHGVLNKQLQSALKTKHKRFLDSHSLSKSTHSVSNVSSTKRTEATGVMNPIYDMSVDQDSVTESTNVPDKDQKKSFQSDEVKQSLSARVIKFARRRSWLFKTSGKYSPMEAKK